MRFRWLKLIAFGSFTDRVLDFSTAPGALHVVYGLNEAGKSTALRAVRGLLFGIPSQTPDAHSHAMKDLRIGASIEMGDGRILEVVRRKGNKQTLLDPSGTPLDDGLLSSALGGVSEELFQTMFGLDDNLLRAGAVALLDGKGDVGESLFSAGIGGGRLHKVLAELRDEAEGIYSSRARNKPLNEAIHRYEEARGGVRDLALKPDAWKENEQAIVEAQKRIDALKEEEGVLSTYVHRLERAKRVLPQLARRARLLDERRALGDVVELPESVTRDREEGEREARESTAARNDLAVEIADLERRRESLSVPTSLIAQEAAIEELTQLMGRDRQAASDRPKREGELRQIEDEARGILRTLGRGADLNSAEKLRISPASRAKIDKLGLAKGKLDERQRQAIENLARHEAELLAASAELFALPPARNGTALALVIERANREGNLEERHAKECRAASSAQRAADNSLAVLGLWGGSLSDVEKLPVPLPETIERFDALLASLHNSSEQFRARDEDLERRHGGVERDLEALRRSGDVPTEDDLRHARAVRDDVWGRVVRVWKGGADEATEGGGLGGATLDRAFQAHVEEADTVADRLRRESDRVARLASLLAERDAATIERESIRRERAGVLCRLDETTAEWRATWRDTGIEPLSPKEMLAWLGRHERLIGVVQKLHETASQRDATARQIVQHRATLVEALSAVSESPDPDATLATLLEEAVAVGNTIFRDQQSRKQLVKKVEQLDGSKDALQQEKEQADAAVDRWSSDWTEAMTALGLPANSAPEEANATLVEIDKLFSALDKRTQIVRRIEGIDRNAGAFVAKAEALLGEHAPDLRPASSSVEAWIGAAERAKKRYDQGRKDHATAAQLDGELEKKRVALAREELRSRRAANQLAALQAAAGAADLASLKELERRSLQATTVTRDLRSVDDTVLAAGDGRSIDKLMDETEGFNVDRASAEAAQHEQRLEQIRSEQQDAAAEIGKAKEALRVLQDQQSAAVDAAADAQEHLARIRGCAQRYARVHLASVLLEREIERYRERNQGPLFGRASDLFRGLTGGTFQSLRTAFDDDDKAVLRCIAAGGGDKDVAGLSTGTRDQLYLALRIASLERYCRTNEPLPLILDDVLIQFDDPRASNALAVLGELSTHMQILYFTHHQRDVTLARKAVPSGVLQEHGL